MTKYIALHIPYILYNKFYKIQKYLILFYKKYRAVVYITNALKNIYALKNMYNKYIKEK